MKRKNLIYRILLAGLILLNFSCERYRNCLDGNGILETEERIVAEFFGVRNETSFDVEIIADSFYRVEVTADENLLSFIETSVRGGDLIIDVDNDRCIKPRENTLIEIRVPTLDLVELTGSGDMDVYDIDCEYFEVTSTGSGDINILNLYSNRTVDIVASGSGEIKISGKTNRANYKLSGSGDIMGDDLRANDCYIASSGSGDIYCWAYDLIDIQMSGSGDVTFYGTAEDVYRSNSGSGDIRDRRN